MCRPFAYVASTERLILWCVFALSHAAFLAASASAQTTEGLKIVPLVRGDRVLVSFELADGFTPDVRAAIQSGLKTTFTYEVQLRLDVPLWVDRLIGTATVTNSVEYDNLTRSYSIIRMVDGRTLDRDTTDSEAVVRRWLTRLVQLPLFRTDVLEPNREYYVRVHASARPSNGSILWPFGSGISAQTKFTFIR